MRALSAEAGGGPTKIKFEKNEEKTSKRQRTRGKYQPEKNKRQ